MATSVSLDLQGPSVCLLGPKIPLYIIITILTSEYNTSYFLASLSTQIYKFGLVWLVAAKCFHTSSELVCIGTPFSRSAALKGLQDNNFTGMTLSVSLNSLPRQRQLLGGVWREQQMARDLPLPHFSFAQPTCTSLLSQAKPIALESFSKMQSLDLRQFCPFWRMRLKVTGAWAFRKLSSRAFRSGCLKSFCRIPECAV